MTPGTLVCFRGIAVARGRFRGTDTGVVLVVHADGCIALLVGDRLRMAFPNEARPC